MKYWDSCKGNIYIEQLISYIIVSWLGVAQGKPNSAESWEHFTSPGMAFIKLASSWMDPRHWHCSFPRSFHRMAWTQINFSLSWNSLTHIIITLWYWLKLPSCVICAWHSFQATFIKVSNGNLCWFCVGHIVYPNVIRSASNVRIWWVDWEM